MPLKIGILVLAAGYSQRFGSDKRLARYRGGQSLLGATLQALRQAQLPIRVCLRDDHVDREWASAMLAAVQPVFCDRSREGMGTTLAQGIAVCGDWDVTLVALGDMPEVGSHTLRQLAGHAGPAVIVIPVFDRQRGHPVAFGRRFYPQLRRLTGDTGARSILAGAGDALVSVATDDAGVVRDVDTPAALREAEDT